MTEERLEAQLRFLSEVDRLKTVERQSPIADRSRRENSAEHSWHLAVCALILGGLGERVDLGRVIAMLLIHDIVEIDAGDHPLHSDASDAFATAAAERASAVRIFGLLPQDQATHLIDMWSEFEAAASPEARFAKCLDRFQPLMLNILAGGGTWTMNSVTEEQVQNRYGPAIQGGAPLLWAKAAQMVSKHFKSVRDTTADCPT